MNAITEWEDKQELFCFEIFAKKYMERKMPEFIFDYVEVEENSIETCWRLNMLNDEGIEFSKWWRK